MTNLEEYRELPLDKNMYGAVSGAVFVEVNRAVSGAVDDAVFDAVSDAVYWEVSEAVFVDVYLAFEWGFQDD